MKPQLKPVEYGPELYFKAEYKRLKKLAPTKFHRWIIPAMRAAAWPDAPHYVSGIMNAYLESPDWTIEALRQFRAKLRRDPAGFAIMCSGRESLEETDGEVAQNFNLSKASVKKARQRAARGTSGR